MRSLASLTHCAQGHDLRAPGAVRAKGNGNVCRLCDNARETAYARRRRLALMAAHEALRVRLCPRGHDLTRPSAMRANATGVAECVRCLELGLRTRPRKSGRFSPVLAQPAYVTSVEIWLEEQRRRPGIDARNRIGGAR